MQRFMLVARTGTSTAGSLTPMATEAGMTVEREESFGSGAKAYIISASSQDEARQLAESAREQLGAAVELFGAIELTPSTAADEKVTEALEESFPASDPPSFTPER